MDTRRRFDTPPEFFENFPLNRVTVSFSRPDPIARADNRADLNQEIIFTYTI